MVEACDSFRVEDTDNSERCDCQYSTIQSNQPFCANVAKDLCRKRGLTPRIRSTWAVFSPTNFTAFFFFFGEFDPELKRIKKKKQKKKKKGKNTIIICNDYYFSIFDDS